MCPPACPRSRNTWSVEVPACVVCGAAFCGSAYSVIRESRADVCGYWPDMDAYLSRVPKPSPDSVIPVCPRCRLSYPARASSGDVRPVLPVLYLQLRPLSR